MKHFFALLLITMHLLPANAQQWTALKDTHRKPGVTDTFLLNSENRAINTYDSAANLVQSVSQHLTNGIWINERFFYKQKYNSTHQLTEGFTQKWNGNKWVNQGYEKIDYANNGKNTCTTEKIWADTAWVNNERILKLDTIETYLNWSNGGWINAHRTINSYNWHTGYRTEIKQDWNAGQWKTTGSNTWFDPPPPKE